MIKKSVVVLIIMLFSFLLGAETQIIPLLGLGKPEGIFFDKAQMYITEGTSISIYSLKDYKLIKKIGKTGEGPQEFMVNPLLGGLFLNTATDDLFVHSLGKLSWFSKDGVFIKEQKLPYPYIRALQPFGKNIIGTSLSAGNERWRILNLYDEKINAIKEIAKIKDSFQPGKGLRIQENNPVYDIYEGRLYMAWENEFIIKVLDSELQEQFTIKHPYQRQKFSKEDEHAILEFLKTDPNTRDYLDRLKPIIFPDYYPPIVLLTVTGNKIYAVTFTSDKDKKKFDTYVFDLKGKFLEKVAIPILWEKPMKPYPITIYDGKVYHLVDNPDTEEWALHITDIK